jgi:hypothetical protein
MLRWRRDMEQVVYTAVATFVSFVLVRTGEYFIRGRRERRRQAEEFEEFRQEVEKLHMETREVYKAALKGIITNETLGTQARFDAYDEYRKAGGNSWVDRYVEKHLKNIGD